MTDYTVKRGYTSNGITLTNSGDRLFVSGTANNVYTDNNTKVYVDGGTVSTLTVRSGGYAQIESPTGGTINNLYLSSGGQVDINAGNLNNSVVSSGGYLTAARTGKITGATLESGSHATVFSGGTLSNFTVASDAKLLVFSGGNIAGGTVEGLIDLRSGAKIEDKITLLSGGSATIRNNVGGTILLPGDTNRGLTISGLESGGTVSTVISGFSGTAPGDSDSIDLAGVSAEGASYDYPSNDQVIITLASGAKITLNILNVKNTGFVLVDDGNGGALAEVCFLSGSMIATTEADVAVETLAVGDVVKTWNWQSQSVENRTIVWVGKKHMTVKAGLADDDAGYPVRVLKNAIAEGVPYKDMLITPEHSLFFENKFVPVRMLVNGRSIFYDRSIQSYDYFHIETEDHSVIWADGMMTESYLDTGNRSTFRQEGTVVRLGQTEEKDWASDAAAELEVSRPVVEMLYRQIDSRARQNGLPQLRVEPKLVTDPDLHLVTDKGQVIRQVRSANDTILFMIPSGVETVYLASRASKPSETIGPFVDDRRSLGVLVGKIQLIRSGKVLNIDTHLTANNLPGWNVKEASPCRWTNGYATLPLGSSLSGHFGMLSLQILAAGPYIQTENTEISAQKTV